MLKQAVSLLIVLAFLAQNTGWAASQNYTSRKKELIPSVYQEGNADKVAAAVGNKKESAALIDDLLNRNLKRRGEILKAGSFSPAPRAARPVAATMKPASAIPQANPPAPSDQAILDDFMILVEINPRASEIHAILESAIGVTSPWDDVEKQILLKNVLKKNLNSNPFSRFTAILELKDAVTALSPTDRWKVEAYLENTYGGLDLAVDRPTRDQFNRLVAPGGILFNTDGTRFQNPFRQLLASPDDVEANFLADVDASPDRAMIRNILQSAFGTSRTNFNDSMTSQVEKYILHNYGILYDSVGDPLLRPLAPFEAIVKTIKDAEGSQETRDRLEQLGVDVNDGISFEEFSILTQGPAGDPALIIEVGFLLKRLREPDPRTQELVNLKNFNHLFGADIQATGTLKGEEPELLFGIVGTPDLEKTVEIDEAYNEDNFLKILTPASNLLTELEKPGNETFLADFNSIFGTGITTGVNDLNAYDRKVLLDIVGAASFNLDRFKLALPKAKLLLTYLTTVATSTDLANFNGFFGTSITAISIPVNLRVEWGAFFDATEVMDLASDVEIKELIAAIPKAELFLTYLTTIATSADLATFNRLFGASITATSTVANLGDDRGALFDATEAMKTASNVELIEFFRVLPLAARLLVALQSDPVALDGFNMVFGANLVLASSPANPAAPRVSILANPLRISFDSVVGVQYQIQTADSVVGPWTNFEAPKPGTGSRIIAPVPSDKPYKFYRVLVSSGTQQTPISKEARKALFDVAGTPDIDTDKDGVLIEPNDPKEKDEAYNEVKFIILIKAVRPFYNDYAAVSPEVRADADFILTALGVDQLKPGTQVNIGDGINRDELTVLADNGVLTREYGAARPKPFQSFEVATRFLRWVNTSVDSVRIKEAYLNYYGLDLRDPAKDPAEAADFSRPWKASNISKDAWKILVDKIFYDKFGIPRFG